METVSKGAVSDTAADILRKHLNPALKGDAWDALVEAMATGDATNTTNAALAFNQLFKSSASGIYLTQRAADDGTERPQDVGMPDELFRDYAIKTTNHQLTEESLLEVLEIFYGGDSVRAQAAATINEPYDLDDGDELIVLLDERITVIITFMDEDFAIPSAGRAIEVAAAITRSLRLNGSTAYALAVVDPELGTATVHIYSGSRGLGSSIRILGGQAQTILQFPTLLTTTVPSDLPTWNLVLNPTTNRLRYTPDEDFDVSLVQIGDYVTVYGTMFDEANRGTYEIVDTYWAYPDGTDLVQWFEVVNRTGVDQASVVQLGITNLMVFRPTRATVHATPARAVVVASLGNEVDVIVPATSQAVSRGPLTGAYLHDPYVDVVALERVNGVVTVATATPHGLVEGGQVIIDGVRGVPLIPTPTPGTPSGPHAGTSDSSVASLVSALQPGTIALTVNGASVLLPDGRALYTGGTDPFSEDAANAGSELFHVNSITPFNSGLVVDYIIQDIVGTMPSASAYLGLSVSGPQAYATGGIDATDTVTKKLFNFDPNTSTWGSLTDMGTARASHAQTTLADGRLLVTGGISVDTTPAITLTEVYDVIGDSWSGAASMQVARAGHEQVRLKTGLVVAVGGRTLTSGHLRYSDTDDIGPLLNSVEVYDPMGDDWLFTGPMTYARFQHRAVLLPGDRILVVGGMGYDPTHLNVLPVPLRDAEIWDPGTGRWAPAGRTAYAHDFVMAEYIASRNQVVVMGGTFSEVVEIYDVGTGRWSLAPAQMPVKSAGGRMVQLANDLLVILGGANPADIFTPPLPNLYIPGADRVMAGGLNGFHRVESVISNNGFTYLTPDETAYTLHGSYPATVERVAAEDPPVLGPFMWDPDEGIAVTGTESILTMALTRGTRYASIEVADATQFPDANGWLVFAFGYENQVAPVKYFGRLSDTTLAVDYSFRFGADVAAGTRVTLLAHKGAFLPDDPVAAGSLYVTASPAGRVAALAAIDEVVGAGILVNKTITYPGDRGLGGEGLPAHGSYKLSDKVEVWAGNDIDAEIALAKEG